MTNLSPQAQAVLDAANIRNSYGPDDCLNESHWIVADALRAVACQIENSSNGMSSLDILRQIATELDNL